MRGLKKKLRGEVPFPRTPAWLAAALLAGAPAAAWAQDTAAPAAEPGLQLRTSPLLREDIPAAVRGTLPMFVTGDQVSGQTDLQTVIDGNAELRRGDTVIRADRLEYYQPDDMAHARGNVHINRAGNVYDGDRLQLRVEAFEGFFTDVRYRFLNEGHGEATRVDFLDSQHSVVTNGTYTTCLRQEGPSWLPDWIMRAATLRIDREEDVGTAENAVLSFKGIPVLAAPSISFPLSDKRKSGLLPPTLGIDSQSGIEYTQPYYWNIAPNRDATLYGAVMSKRGVQGGAEFRYLEPTFQGEVRADLLPGDRLRERDRWDFAAKHSGYLTGVLPGIVGYGLTINRVSDDNYWRDFPRTSPSVTQRLLPNDFSASWGYGDYFFTSLRMQKWQTLQDVTSPIAPPYDRMPQWHAAYSRMGWGGLDVNVEGDYTDFQGDRAFTQQPNARRSYTLAQVSRPFIAPGWFVTPKMQLHATDYQFDGMLANGQRTATRTVPTLSVDSGLVFERDASYFGRSFVQTLEPRAFYVYTPYRDQSMLPNYDSAANDFNFASVYTENAFGGNDRISDNNLLTLGVTTRLFDPDTGAQAASFGIAQRLRFKDQRVTLPSDPPVSERLSDVLLGASLSWAPQWNFDSTVQYNPKTSRSIRSTIGARYSPGNYRVISAAYRLQRDSSEQIDVGWQWPLNDLWGDRGKDRGPGRGLGGDRWYSVGRLNYSMQDKKLVDTVVGIEYDACCWIGRVVFERLQNTVSSSNTRILFQLEFSGFTRVSLGSNPLSSLKQNIPGYQYLREQVTTPSRFSNYD
ncbi:LPS-assembly protein LptD [Ramlibacter sp. H39-3-26]|nr:LPS-assembly protein LptD [Ramlibacter sp. H39-3-26]MDF1485565.1 LPS-assembly protein LptD [Ramlibacter sp. H39-3-26]